MAGEQTVSTLDGFFKDQFADKLNELIPDHAILQKDGDNALVSWVESSKMNGEFYSVPTVLRSNQGVTYLGESGAVASLKTPKNAVMKEAQVKGSEMNVRGQISYKTLSQAAEKGARAFAKASAWLVDDLAKVIHTRIEIAALYGQTGLGTVSSYANVSGNTHDVVFTEASWAPGMWILLEGAVIQLFNGTSERASGVTGTVGVVTTSSRTVRIAFSGAITPTAADVAFFDGANAGSSSFNEMVGLYKQLTDASSTLFNLDRSAYALIQGNTYAAGGKITKAKITDFAMRLIDGGAMGRLVCLVSTKAWGVLNAEDMALRRFGEAKEKSKSGAKELVYDVNVAEIRVICHPFVKYGEAFMFNPDDVIWVGSAKPTFDIPGFEGKEFFRLVDGSNAVELQNYADLAIYALKPKQGGVMTGITYS